MTAPLVTVVIPVHDGERYLPEAVASVLGQTHSAVQVIVVDDGSTDGTAAAAAAFGDAVEYVHQENAGPAAAMNRGAGRAGGELISFLSADDVWVPEKLALQLAALRAGGPDLVFGHVRHFLSPELDAAAAARLRCPPEPMPATSAGTLLTRLDTFWRVGPFDEGYRVGEFLDWYSRAGDLGLTTLILPGVVSHRRVHGANHSLRERAPASYAQILKANLERRRAAADG